jgi:ribose/xylose/arabinose/galactoside ABC-type transport system permease subunit
LTGGMGDVIGTALGVLFIAILQNGLGLAGISSNWQDVLTGLILILAVGGTKFRPTRGFSRRLSFWTPTTVLVPQADITPDHAVEP